MKIDKNIAKEIVLKLSDIIEQNINIMDTDGVIIASGDSTRIGQVHGGAVKLLSEGLSELIVESDHQFPGAKSGINLPIIFENETVGTIGITGGKEVLKFGQIIKHMTEILLLEERAKEQLTIEQKSRDRFYEEWIIGSLEEKNPSEFRRLSSDLEIDIEKPYRILALTVEGDTPVSADTLTDISRYIRNVLRKELNGNAFRTATHMVCIIPESKSDLLQSVMKSVKDTVFATYSCPLSIGASNEEAVLHLTASYEKAALSMERASDLHSSETITFYDDFDINYMIKNISLKTRDNYLFALFKNIPREEMADHLKFAECYLSNNGSLDAIASALFIHKNTVKYRISKLTALTGVDIRTCYGAYVFTMACLLRGASH